MPGTSGERAFGAPTGVSRIGMTGALVVQAPRLQVRPGRPHHETTQVRLPFIVYASRLQGGKSEIRISKSEIRNCFGWPAFLIPNS
jgi:hypothetical protein